MAQTFKITRAQALKLHEFCTKHKKTEFFVAKDQGAYVGANTTVKGRLQKVIFYMPGCDPVKDKDWYDTAHAKYGGDDFGEMLPVGMLKRMVERVDLTSMAIKLTATKVTIDYFA